jgi:pyruvate,water dikinase
MAEFSQREGITEDEIECEPMRHFWAGILREGWPTPLKGPAGSKGPLATIFEPARGENYSESSFAILGKEYMIVSLRMGYHFTTVEAMCSEDQQKNYVRMQYHEGGATPERRERRIKLITDVLSRLGFEHYAKGDFLDTRLTYRPAAKICRNLYQLGRLTMLTKQLDMALSNDRVAEWYTRQFLRRLGIE